MFKDTKTAETHSLTPIAEVVIKGREEFEKELKGKVISHSFDGSCCYNNNEQGKGHLECRYPYNLGRENPTGEQCLKLKEEHFDIYSKINTLLLNTLEALEKEVEEEIKIQKQVYEKGKEIIVVGKAKVAGMVAEKYTRLGNIEGLSFVQHLLNLTKEQIR